MATNLMLKMFEKKKSILIKKNQELQKLSESAEISEYKRLVKDILKKSYSDNLFYTFIFTDVSNRRGSKAGPDCCIKRCCYSVRRGKE